MLQRFKFTNVYRELDPVTVWIRVNWREPYDTDPDVWFAMACARLVNWPPSLETVGYPVPWRPERFKARMHCRAEAGEQLFTGAYMLNQTAPGGKGRTKYDYTADCVLTPMWARRKELRPRLNEPLAAFHARLTTVSGIGSFMAAQIVADTKYTDLLRGSPDWCTWAAPGPGSERGLNIVYGRPPEARWRPEVWLEALTQLRSWVNAGLEPEIRSACWERLHAQDLQNCLCEYSKYVRGYSRTRYPGEA